MSILSDQEIDEVCDIDTDYTSMLRFARAIESALLSKLAQGVSMEPHYHNRIEADGTIVYVPWYTPEQLTTAIAAARVAALEEAAKVAECYGPSRPIVTIAPSPQIKGRWEGEQAASGGIADAIRALIGKQT